MTRTHVSASKICEVDGLWVDGFMGLLVLVVQYADKFSLPEGGSIILFFVFQFSLL